MLIVASDISTEVYFSYHSDAFRREKLDGDDNFDPDSRLQLYAAPLILGFYAICERNGSSMWESPQEGRIYYIQAWVMQCESRLKIASVSTLRKASDLIVMIVQLEEDEILANRYLAFFAELIELICGPLASYSLSRSGRDKHSRSR